MILREIEGTERERDRNRRREGGAEEACWQRGRGRKRSEKTGEGGREGGGGGTDGGGTQADVSDRKLTTWGSEKER
jgi:hypothetical protein